MEDASDALVTDEYASEIEDMIFPSMEDASFAPSDARSIIYVMMMIMMSFCHFIGVFVGFDLLCFL